MPLDTNGRLEATGLAEEATIDGVTIHCGDLIVGDCDGVMVVPWQNAAKVVQRALEKLVNEGRFRDAVASGMKPSAAFRQFGVL